MMQKGEYRMSEEGVTFQFASRLHLLQGIDCGQPASGESTDVRRHAAAMMRLQTQHGCDLLAACVHSCYATHKALLTAAHPHSCCSI
jgi:hypothetical protein